MKIILQEEIKSLASEFTYSDKKMGIVGAYCEPNFPFYYASEELVSMLGYDSLEDFLEAIGGDVVNTIHPEDLDQVKKDIGESYYEGMTYETTYRMLKKDGNWFWIVDKGKIYKAEDGRLVMICVCTDMSKFVQRQKELEAKSQVADYLFKNLPGGYHRCAIDDGYTFLYVSEHFLELLGWTKEELETLFDNKFYNLLHPQDRHLEENYVASILNGSEGDPYQEAIYRLCCKDGYHWFSDTTMKATVAGESFFQGFITDISSFITERQQNYDILKSVYDQMARVDLENDSYNMIQVQDGYEIISQERPDAQKVFFDMAQKSIMESYMPQLMEFLDFSTLGQRLANTDSIFIEYMDRAGNWNSLSFLVQSRNINNKPAKLLFTISNINKQKQAELNQQRLTEIRLQTMSEAIHGGFKRSKNDDKFTFIMVSEQLVQILGYDSAQELMELSGGSMAGISDPVSVRSQLPQVWKAVEAGEMYTMQYRVRCKDGSWKNIEDRGRLIVNENGEEEFWSFIVDKDEMVKTSEALAATKEGNRELAKARNELKEARDKADAANLAKTQFLFNMSHDIRTPMNAILGYNQLMKKKLTDPVLLDYQDKIDQSGNLLLSIINNVLDMARIESGKMELDENYARIEEVGDDIYDAFAREAEKKNIAFFHERNVPHKHIMCDITKVKQIFFNLVSNAVKYTPSGKSILIRTVELPCNEEGHIILRTEIADTGIGMSSDFLPHIFDSFERERNTTTSKIHGTGLGMSIVKRLVDLLGGTIEVESELGKGTSFFVTLKYRLADSAYYDKAKSVKSIDDIEARIRGAHVLLAEDNELNAEIATEVLSDEGIIVDHVNDGIQCVAQMEKSPAGTYDMIFMDIQMPLMDGYKATQEIRHFSDSKKADIPIIAMTANAFEEDRQNAIKAGMNAHLAKPLDIQKVKKIIAEYCVNRK